MSERVASSAKRQIIHVDMDAFFAAIEEQRHPEYKGKPLIIGGSGDPSKRGVVSTASYAARKYGIKSGMPLRTAYKRCPQAVFLPVDFKKYCEVSAQFMIILRDFTSLIESWGLDEAFLDITAASRKAVKIAWDLKQRIRAEMGLTASVGVGPNKLLAKIASDLNKPNGLMVIEETEVEKVLAPLPVSKLLWVGKKTTARLREMGINTIGDLLKVPLDTLKARFGKAYGQMLYSFARGMDESPVVTYHEPKSFGRETTFQVDTCDLNLVKRVLSGFVKYLVKELREGGYRGKTVTVKIRYSNFSTHTRAHSLPESTDSPQIIYDEVLALLPKFDLTRKIRLVGLRVSGLEKKAR
ncbi:MAG: DNA polymerase IV [Actinomycetota bacterium]|nr:DNA polymerase IV [Actinomycetota bacterium]